MCINFDVVTLFYFSECFFSIEGHDGEISSQDVFRILDEEKRWPTKIDCTWEVTVPPNNKVCSDQSLGLGRIQVDERKIHPFAISSFLGEQKNKRGKMAEVTESRTNIKRVMNV